MTKNDKIHIKLEIWKDEASKELKLLTHFDTTAPNFFKDKDDFLWVPTLEEKDFINEAFDLMPIGETTGKPEKTTPEPPEEKTPPEPSLPPVSKEEEKPEKKFSPFGRKEEEKPVDPQPLEKTQDETVFESTEEETKTDNVIVDTEIKEEDKGSLVKADDDAIEAALKKHDEEDKSIVEADEETIVEKVLSQKKKGKWSRGH